MRKNFSTVLLLALLVTLSVLSSAQNGDRAANQNRCGLFKLHVIEPPDVEQYKLQVIKPDDRVEYKGIVIDPCAAPAFNAVRVEQTTPRLPKFFVPLTPPAEPSNDLFKTPSEMFKLLAPFKPPEKK